MTAYDLNVNGCVRLRDIGGSSEFDVPLLREPSSFRRPDMILFFVVVVFVNIVLLSLYFYRCKSRGFGFLFCFGFFSSSLLYFQMLHKFYVPSIVFTIKPQYFITKKKKQKNRYRNSGNNKEKASEMKMICYYFHEIKNRSA